MAAVEAKGERIRRVDPKELTPHWKNQQIYNDGPDVMLLQSIKERGIIEPLVVDKNSNEVISGCRRHKAALELKLKNVPVIWRSYEDNLSRIEAIVEHNQYRVKTDRQIMLEVEALAEVERERTRIRQERGRVEGGKGGKGVPKKKRKTDEILVSRGDTSISPKKPGIRVRKKNEQKAPPRRTSGEVARKIGRSRTVVENAMAIIDEAKAEHGDDWQQAPEVKAVLEGKCTLGRASSALRKRKKKAELDEKIKQVGKINIDLRNQDNIKDIADESIDHIITDPPYGCATGFAAEFDDRADMSSRFGDWDTGELHLDEIDGWAAEWSRVIKPGGNIGVFCADKYVSFLMAALKHHGFESLLTVVWHKTNPEPSVRQAGFVSSVEYVVTGCKGQKRRTLNWHGQNDMHNHIEAPLCQGKERLEHPAQKPERVIRWLVERLTSPGDRVLDNFAGVGTTGVVCRDLKRYFVLVEKEKRYCDLTRTRFAS